MHNNNEGLQISEPQDFLNYETERLLQYQYATQGQRFLNWLIDNLLMNYGISYITGMGVGVVLNAISPDFLFEVVYGNSWQRLVFLYLVGIVNYVIYYTLCEKLFKGYTLGKLITGTRAIRQDGGELTFRNALLRSVSRLVPFEVFSGFNTLAWHDEWTDTMVIKAR